MAKLYFRYGAMNSGKTTALMQVAYNYKERGMRVLILKPAIDTKGQDSIISRLGISCKVDQLVTPEMDVVELVRANEAAHGKIACVLCDESQFFTPEQADQLFLVTVDLGIPVICYGLRADFMMRGFPGSTRLLEIAHTIEELKTICACGRKAICNGRKVNGEFVFEGAQVAIDTVDDVEYRASAPSAGTASTAHFWHGIPKSKYFALIFPPGAARWDFFCGSHHFSANSALILHRADSDAIIFAKTHVFCNDTAYFAVYGVFQRILQGKDSCVCCGVRAAAQGCT